MLATGVTHLVSPQSFVSGLPAEASQKEPRYATVLSALTYLPHVPTDLGSGALGFVLRLRASVSDERPVK